MLKFVILWANSTMLMLKTDEVCNFMCIQLIILGGLHCNDIFYMLQMWENLILKAKNAGLDVIDTYVFWNIHEPSPGNVSLSILSILSL